MQHFITFQTEKIDQKPIPDCTEEEIQDGKYAIEFEMRWKIDPTAINPDNNHTICFPFKRSVFWKLFPNAEKVPRKKKMPLKYKNTLTVYKLVCTSEDLESILGKEWFLTHCSQSVGVFVGNITIKFKERFISQYKTLIEEEFEDKVMKGSLDIFTRTFLSISFSFTKFHRLEPGLSKPQETDFYKRHGRALARKKFKKIIPLKRRYVNKD
mmetsp:Transcript_1751/g.2781  ORF Transcript_1751/g.2781 Transcript_1751/m.2781 type:complete len:211 (-) Transcript_1751:3035-3667(-)